MVAAAATATTTTAAAATTTTVTEFFKVGERVECFWTHYSEWFSGTVTDFHQSDNTFQVLYDDGESWWHPMGEIDVRVEQVK